MYDERCVMQMMVLMLCDLIHTVKGSCLMIGKTTREREIARGDLKLFEGLGLGNWHLPS